MTGDMNKVRVDRRHVIAVVTKEERTAFPFATVTVYLDSGAVLEYRVNSIGAANRAAELMASGWDEP